MSSREDALVFDCAGESLIGILNPVAGAARRGALIVVGGPNYRAGSGRQFTLLARRLAREGVPALRFDYRGMGDSGGAARTFERVSEDIRCAIDRLVATAPSIKEVVIWGLCDAASAALMYAHADPRVSGLVLLNPWVRTTQGLARTHLKYYYMRRLFQASLWQKLFRGEFDFGAAASALRRIIVEATGKGRRGSPRDEAPFLDRMEEGLRSFRGKILLILSGNDLTAQEFKDYVRGSERWQSLLARDGVTRRDLPDANHTFARRDWRDQVEAWTADWVKAL